MLAFFLFILPKLMMHYDGIVTSSSIGQETSLSRSNDRGEDWLDSIDNDFNNKFVHSIAQSNWYEILKNCDIGTLSDQA